MGSIEMCDGIWAFRMHLVDILEVWMCLVWDEHTGLVPSFVEVTVSSAWSSTLKTLQGRGHGNERESESTVTKDWTRLHAVV